MAQLMKQQKMVLKKIKEMNDTLETVAESIDVLIKLETERIKKS